MVHSNTPTTFSRVHLLLLFLITSALFFSSVHAQPAEPLAPSTSRPPSEPLSLQPISAGNPVSAADTELIEVDGLPDGHVAPPLAGLSTTTTTPPLTAVEPIVVPQSGAPSAESAPIVIEGLGSPGQDGEVPAAVSDEVMADGSVIDVIEPELTPRSNSNSDEGSVAETEMFSFSPSTTATGAEGGEAKDAGVPGNSAATSALADIAVNNDTPVRAMPTVTAVPPKPAESRGSTVPTHSNAPVTTTATPMPRSSATSPDQISISGAATTVPTSNASSGPVPPAQPANKSSPRVEGGVAQNKGAASVAAPRGETGSADAGDVVIGGSASTTAIPKPTATPTVALTTSAGGATSAPSATTAIPTAVPPSAGAAPAKSDSDNTRSETTGKGPGSQKKRESTADETTVLVDMGKPYKKETVHYTGAELPKLVVKPSEETGKKCYVKRERCCHVETACGYDCHNRWFKVCQEKSHNGKGGGRKCRWLNERRCYPKICMRERCVRLEPSATPTPTPDVHWNVMVTKIEDLKGDSFDMEGNPV